MDTFALTASLCASVQLGPLQPCFSEGTSPATVPIATQEGGDRGEGGGN